MTCKPQVTRFAVQLTCLFGYLQREVTLDTKGTAGGVSSLRAASRWVLILHAVCGRQRSQGAVVQCHHLGLSAGWECSWSGGTVQQLLCQRVCPGFGALPTGTHASSHNHLVAANLRHNLPAHMRVGHAIVSKQAHTHQALSVVI